jgi:AcrR family transcriptional regulator
LNPVATRVPEYAVELHIFEEMCHCFWAGAACASLMAMKPRERTPPWAAGAKTDRTREQILDGARLTFQEVGYASTRVEHIAKRAGVSRPTFYVYFATKQDAFLAVAERSVRQLEFVLKGLDALPQRPDDGELASWVGQFFSYFDDFGAFATVWRQAAFADPALQQSGWKAQRRWATRIGRNIDRIRGSSLGDPVSQGLAFEAMLEALWFSSIVDAPGASRHSALATATAMVRALIPNT